MFVLKSKYIKSIDKQLEYLDRIEALKKSVSELCDLRDANWKSDVSDASIGIDFDKINAFSVERNRDNGEPRTIIGYLKPNGEVGEWYYDCTLEMHNELVLQFNVHRNKVVVDGNTQEG